MPTFGNSGEFKERVKCLRLLRRWDQGTLAVQVGVSTTVISQIETGRIKATPEQVDGIAAALGYSPEFLGAELKLAPTTRPWLRAYADASRREAEARTAFATIAAEYIRRLNLKLLPDLIPPFSGDVEDDHEIEDAAVELRALADIEPDAVISNAVRIAERLGCVVLPLESELGRHLGMSVRSDHIPIMCVARDGVPGDRQRFTVAHELAHLTLHGQAAPPRNATEAGRMEKQANRFAAAFLAPGDAVIDTLNEYGGKVTLQSLVHVKSTWGIAIKALVGRYQSLGVIDTDHARSLYKQLSARKWTKVEPVDVATESAQWFERALLLRAGSQSLITATEQLAATMGGNASDLFEFANWTPRREAQILSMTGRRQR